MAVLLLNSFPLLALSIMIVKGKPVHHGIQSTVSETRPTFPSNSDVHLKHCSREYFLKEYKTAEDLQIKSYDVNYVYQNCPEIARKCRKSAYTQSEEVLEELNSRKELEMSMKFHLNFKDCFGYVFKVTGMSPDGTYYNEKKFITNGTEIERKYVVAFRSNFYVELHAAPTSKFASFNITAQGRCEVFLYSQFTDGQKTRNWKENDCISKSPKDFIVPIKEFCKSYKNQSFLEDDLLLDVYAYNVVTNSPEGKRCTKKEKDNDMYLLTATYIFISLLCCAVFVALKYKWKTVLYHIHQRMSPGNDITVPINTEDVGPTVLIINRPGCNVVEDIVTIVSSILKSHGIRVIIPFVDDNVDGSEGDVLIFLQQHIQYSDFILIMPTESNVVRFTKHKLFDFSLTMISREMVHSKKNSKYIMIYLDSYKKALTYMPKLFYVAPELGYKVPRDMKNLVKLIISNTHTDQVYTKHQKERQSQYTTRLRNLQEKMLKETKHEECQERRCQLGTILPLYPSVTNLPTEWGTTVKSVSSSFESLNEGNMDEVTEVMNMMKDADKESNIELNDKIRLWSNNM